jgi:hypothetical protein
MNGFQPTKVKSSLAVLAVLGITGFSLSTPVKALQPSEINPVYSTQFDETITGITDPAIAALPASYAYYFETNKNFSLINALGLPIVNDWAVLSPIYVVNLYKVTNASTTTPNFSILKTVNFNQVNAGTYIAKDGFYWIPFDAINLGLNSLDDPDLVYAVGSVGNFSDSTGIGIFQGGTGTFDPDYSYAGSGFNAANSPFYANPPGFPYPFDYDDTDPLEPFGPYGYFSANVSYKLVPGPLPLFGAGIALGWSRRLRTRVRRATKSTTAN